MGRSFSIIFDFHIGSACKYYYFILNAKKLHYILNRIKIDLKRATQNCCSPSKKQFFSNAIIWTSICPKLTRIDLPNVDTHRSAQSWHASICPKLTRIDLPKVDTHRSAQSWHAPICPKLTRIDLPKVDTLEIIFLRVVISFWNVSRHNSVLWNGMEFPI